MKLSKRQKTALEKSIKKWEGIVDEEGGDNGRIDCKCCENYRKKGCHTCPVYLKTGLSHCYDTPYSLWDNYMDSNKKGFRWGTRKTAFDEKSKQLAQAELDFLRGILAEAA